MLTAIDHYGNLPYGALDTLREIDTWLRKLPDRPGKKGDEALWSCHGLARAAKKRFDLKEWSVCDGFFGRKGTCHGWLFLPASPLRRGKAALVLDVSPMGGVGPFIASMQWMLPWKDLYLVDPDYYGERLKSFDDEAAAILSLPLSG